jgi:PAS domain S-box-containing protein
MNNGETTQNLTNILGDNNSELFNSILESISDAFYSLDCELRYIAFNKTHAANMQSLYGTTIELGKKMPDYQTVSEDKAESYKNYQKALRGERVLVEVSVGDAALSQRFKSISHTPLYNSSNQIIGLSVYSKDITERKQAEAELKEKEVQYRNMANSGMALIWTAGTDKLCNYFNGPWLDYTGRTIEQEMGNGWAEGVHPDDFDRCLETYITAFDRREAFSMEYRLRHASGEYRWLIDMGTPNFNSKGEFVGYIGHCFDINDRKNAEKQLQENYHLLGKLTAQVPGVVYQYRLYPDGHSAFPYSSEGMYDIYEVTPDEVREDASPVFTRIHPDDYDNIVDTIMESARNQTIYHSEFRVILPKKGLRWGKCDAKPELLEDGSTLWYGIITDITEQKNVEHALKESNNRLMVILENTPIAIWDWDLKTDRWYATQNYYSMLGYEPEKDFQDRKIWLNRIHPDDRQMVNDKIAIILNHNDENYSYEARMLHADGSYRWQTVIGQVVERDASHKTSRLIGVRLDVNDRKKIELELRESEERFKVLFEKAPDAMFLADTETKKIVDANSAACSLFKKGKNELIGLYQHELHPENLILKSKEEFDVHINQRLNTGPILAIENTIITSEGNEIPVEILGQSIKIGERELLLGTFRDISERKKTSEILKRSEERYSSLLLHLETGVVVHAADTTIMMSNPRASELLGLSNEQMLGKVAIDPDWKFLDTDNKPLHLDNYPVNRVLRSKQPISNQILGIQQSWNSEIVWVNVNGFPVLNKDGKMTEIVISFNDITERKIAEEKIIESERELKRQNGLFDSLIRNLPMGVFMVDAHSGKPLLANDAALTLLGRGILPDANRQNLHDVYDAYKTGSNIKYPVDEMPVIRGMKGESSRIDDMLVKRPDGTETLLEIFGSPVADEDGNIWASLVSFMDITDRKKAEEALRASEEKLSTLFSSMTEMVVIHELVFNVEHKAVDYIILDSNQMFTNITGIKREDTVGKLGSEVYNTTPPPYLDIYSEVALTGKSHEFNVHYAPLDKHFIISVVSPSKNQFATITSDITAIKQFQLEITDKNKELESYLYVASHDLRSPLVNIQGFSLRLQKQSNELKSIAKQLELNTELREKLDKLTDIDVPRTLNFILSNVTKMDSLINSLLQISRTGRLALNVTKLNVNNLLDKVIATYNFEITENNVQLIINNLPPCYGDENQLNQVFSNIIGNAIKYRSANRPLKIRIKATQTRNNLIYSISDNGIGISERHLNKIWDVFYRVDASATEAGEGIGLSIAKTIVGKHKGRIWVESEEGVGSVFYIELQENAF